MQDQRETPIEPVTCDCGTEMVLRSEGREEPIRAGGEAVRFRGYACPDCSAVRRFEWSDGERAWRRADG